MLKKILFTALLFLVAINLKAQSLSGKIYDKQSKEPLLCAYLKLESSAGKIQEKISDTNGNYSFDMLKSGTYSLTVTYIGYKKNITKIEIKNKNLIKDIVMIEDSQLLNGAVVKNRAIRAEQRGDSLSYNAEAFKVMEGSTVEEMLTKIPGIVVQDGKVEAQGEQVKKVLVDGREFFGGDVNLALKNLPADIISTIQVFDKKSEQAEFTGFDDGQEIKTINIITKNTFNEGTFGEVNAAYGTEERYRVNGNLNIFNGAQRISLLGMSNNVNQQNFSQEDLAGVMSSSNNGGQRGRRPGSGRRNGGGGAKGGMRHFYNPVDNFVVGNMGGITSSNGLGVNYADKWGDKFTFTGSYFLNQSKNISETETFRKYFESDLQGLTYNEENNTEQKNWNNRINMKMDYKMNERTSIMFSPSLSFQNNVSDGNMFGENVKESLMLNSVENENDSDIDAYSLGGDVVVNHRFLKEGRTLSMFLNGNYTNKATLNLNNYIENFTDKTGKDEIKQYGQKNNIKDNSYSVRGKLMYTEKLLDPLQLQLNYKVGYSSADYDKKVYDRSINDLYNQINDDYSNEYESGYLTQSGGMGLHLRLGDLFMMGSADLQVSSLQGNQIYPDNKEVNKNYFNILPSLRVRYALNRTNSFMFRYHTNTISPSITQLQNVVNNSNPLFLYAGNPNLNQQINHSMHLRYIYTSLQGHTFIAMIGSTLQQDHVGDNITIAKEDMTLPSGVELKKGTQYTQPINMDGYYSLQSMLTYGFPVDLIRSNVNLSLSTNYANSPIKFNGIKSCTRELNVIPKLIIGSNINEKLDFTVSYSAVINKMSNSQNSSQNSSYINHNAKVKFGWEIWNGLNFKSSLCYMNYSGVEDSSFDYTIWNASLGYKFLKNKRAEFKIEAFDILSENSSFSHYTGSNYYDYIHTNVLKPYFTVGFTYRLR